MSHFGQDFRYVLRSLLRDRSFSFATISCLSLGLGAAIIMFSIADQMLFRKLPVERPDRVVLLKWRGTFIGGSWRGGNDVFSLPAFRELQAHPPVGLSAIAAQYRDDADVGEKNAATRATVELVSGNYFAALNVKPALGRLLTAADDDPHARSPYVVISNAYWRSRHKSDPSIIGQSLTIDGHRMTIVGVTQPGFQGIEALSASQIFMPLAMKTVLTPTWDDSTRRDSLWLRIFGTLRPGFSLKNAGASISVAYKSVLRQDLIENPRDADFSRRYLLNTIELVDGSKGFGNVREFFATPLRIVMAMVAGLLLIAYTNIASLMVNKTTARQREVAIKLCLGAPNGGVLRTTMIESGLISGVSVVLGLIIAENLTPLLVNLLPSERIRESLRTVQDFRIVLFALSLALLTALAVTLFARLQLTVKDPNAVLKSASNTSTLGVGQMRIRKFLIIAQVALSLVLLTAAGLFVRSLQLLFATRIGLNTDALLEVTLDPSLHGYSFQQIREVLMRFQERLNQTPGIRSATACTFPLLADDYWQNGVVIEGQPSAGKNGVVMAGWNQVLPEFFSTLDVRLLAGREFTDRDVAGTPKVVIINQAFAKKFFPDGNAIGRHISIGKGPLDMEIVGVVGDIRANTLRDEPQPVTYTPALQNSHLGEVTFYIASRSSQPGSLAIPVREALHAVDRSLPLYEMRTVNQQIAETHFTDRIFAFLSSVFGSIATILTAIGLYGVMAYSVVRRRRELAIRLAIGASSQDVTKLVIRELSLLVGAGMLGGLPISLALGRMASAQLYGIRGSDPAVFVAACACVVFVACCAAYLPAQQAARTDAAQALRIS